MTRLAPVLALFVAASFPRAAIAQRVEPFSSVSFSAGPQWETRTNALNAWWVFEPLGEAFVTTPFHLGQLELGVEAHRYHARRERTPAFDALLGYVAWDVGFRPRPDVRIAVGPRAGVYFMDFNVEAAPGLRTETEAALGWHARITVHPVPFVGLYAGGGFMQTYTNIRLRHYHASFGGVLTIKSPRWLRRVLR
ncbi:MAG TPA: hypothetical protein VF190_11640 [Rhodothermales bacterium]